MLGECVQSVINNRLSGEVIRLFHTSGNTSITNKRDRDVTNSWLTVYIEEFKTDCTRRKTLKPQQFS